MLVKREEIVKEKGRQVFRLLIFTPYGVIEFNCTLPFKTKSDDYN